MTELNITERPAGFVSLVEAYEDGFEAGRMIERAGGRTMTEPVIEKATTAEAQGGFSRTAQTAVMSAWVKNPDRKWWTFWRPRLIEGWGVVNFSVYHKGDVNVEIHSSSVSIQEMALARETAKPQSSEYVATGVSDD